MKAEMTLASTSTIGAGRDTSLLAEIRKWIGAFIAERRAESSTRGLSRELADMDDALLRDIGITEGEIWHIRQSREMNLRAL